VPVFFCPGPLPRWQTASSHLHFDDSVSLRAFARDGLHLKAKARYAERYDGWRVGLAEISGSWGEGRRTD